MTTAVAPPYHLPEQKEQTLQRARRISLVSIFAILTIMAAIGLTMGTSEAMKAMWIEDSLSLVPDIAFLVGVHFRNKSPDEEFPYGYRRAVLIAFLAGAVTLFGFGVYILGDSVAKFLASERPSIPSATIFGHRVWMGWVMLAAMAYSVIPPVILGNMKHPLARELYDKALETSATLDKGDWLSGLAGIAGILGIACGLWWADSAAAAFISIEIIRDGWEDLRNSISQLMNKRPTDIEGKEHDPTPDELQHALARLEWVADAQVRLREDGDVLTGEAFVVPRDERDLLRHLEEAKHVAETFEWRLHDINIVPVRRL
jgi:cation diffusion facilitator family transporter